MKSYVYDLHTGYRVTEVLSEAHYEVHMSYGAETFSWLKLNSPPDLSRARIAWEIWYMCGNKERCAKKFDELRGRSL